MTQPKQYRDLDQLWKKIQAATRELLPLLREDKKPDRRTLSKARKLIALCHSYLSLSANGSGREKARRAKGKAKRR